MAEGGIGTIENPQMRETPPGIPQSERNVSPEDALRRWQSAETQQSKMDKWFENKEKEIIANHVEKKPQIPKIVLREEKNWERFNWKNEDKEQLKEKLQYELVLDDKHIDNLMALFLASGNKPDELLEHFDDVKDAADKAVRKKADKGDSDPLTYNEKHEAQFGLLAGLGLNDRKQQDYLQKFVFTEEYRDILTSHLKRERPDNMYELAWQISFSDQEHEKRFGVNGEYPMLEMRVETDENGNVTQGRYVINQANFMRWERERIMHWQDQEPDEYVQYLEKVQLKKEYSSLSLGEILNDHQLYFTDEEGEYFEDLAKQALLEPFILATLREYHIVYKSVMSSDKELYEKLGQMFGKNKMTKKIFGKTLMYYMATLPLDFNGKDSDTTMGAAANTMFLAYYNLSDFDKLEQVLGEDSSFFTRSGMENAIAAEMEKKYGHTGNVSQLTEKYLGKAGRETFDNAFVKKHKDENGKVIRTEEFDHVVNKDAFISFVNYFGTMGPDGNLPDLIKRALKNAVKEQYDFQSKQSADGTSIDDYSLDVAGLIAEANTLWSGGGARNDPNAAGFNALSKALNNRNYRAKMATPDRGNAMGNPATVHQFKMLVVDFMQATRVSESYIVKEVIQPDGSVKKVESSQTKTPLQVMEEMRYISKHHESLKEKLQREIDQAGADSEIGVQKKRELASVETAANVAYKQIAGQLEFKENAMINYVANHLARGRKIYDQVMNAEQIDFDGFVKTDPYTRSVSFDRSKFQKQIQEDFLKPLRYLISTYGELNLNMPVRSTVFAGRDSKGKDKWVYKTMPLGEAMFGYHMLNIPKFRKKEDVKVFGKTIKRDVVKDGKHVIDYDKVDTYKNDVWKQWAMTKLGTDLLVHIEKHHKDPNFNAQYFFTVLEALDSIPSEVLGDENSVKGVMVKTQVFDKEQMAWFKKMSKTTWLQLMSKAVNQDRKRKGEPGLFSDALSVFVNAIFRGY
jgi:hypothetical protein